MAIVEKAPTVEEVWGRLSWWQRFRLEKLGYAIPIGKYQLPGWRGELEFFIYKCRECGELHIDYRHGYSQYLSCLSVRSAHSLK